MFYSIYHLFISERDFPPIHSLDLSFLYPTPSISYTNFIPNIVMSHFHPILKNAILGAPEQPPHFPR